MISEEASQFTPLTGRPKGAIRFPRSKHWRDPFFAFLFIAHLFIIFAIAVSYGVAALTVQQPIEIDIDQSGNESATSDGSSTFETSKILFGIIVSLVSGAVLSVLWIRIMIYFAASLITCSLLAITLLCLGMGITLLSAPEPDISLGVTLIFMSLAPMIYYYCIKERLAFAAANLSIACKALMAIPPIIPLNILTLLFTAGALLVWSLAFIGVIVGEIRETVTSASTGLTYKVSECVTYDYPNLLNLNDVTLTCDDDNNDECHACICSDSDVAHETSPCISYSIHEGIYFSLILSLIWISTTSAGIQLVTTAGGVASWWFSTNVNVYDTAHAAWVRSMTYSLGSISLASLISSLLQLLHIMISMSNRLSILSPLTSCMKSVVSYYHRYALVYCSIYGANYTDACKATNHLFMTLGWETIINDSILHRALNWGNVLVSVSCSLIAYCYCQGVGGMNGVEETIVISAALLIGYAESMVVLNAVTASVGAIYVCFAEDAGIGKANHPDEFNRLLEAWIRFYPKEMESCGYMDMQETNHGLRTSSNSDMETTIQLKTLAEV